MMEWSHVVLFALDSFAIMVVLFYLVVFMYSSWPDGITSRDALTFLKRPLLSATLGYIVLRWATNVTLWFMST